MIDEPTSEIAALYALELLEPAEARAFAQRIEREPELRALVDELTAAAAALAHTAPTRPLPPGLEARVLAAVRTDRKIVPFPSRLLPWLGWAAAAASIAVCIWLQGNNHRLEKARERWEARIAALEAQLQAQERRNSLAELKIATLTSKLAAAPDATAVIVWDEQKQRGLLKLSHVPQPKPGEDYQLWVIDPQYPKPVNAGVFPVEQPGFSQVSFRTDKQIGVPQKFAVSLEKKGGVPEARGPIVLIGE